MLNAKAYIRVSTDQQAETGMSLDTQTARIQEHCNYKKYNLTKIYTDIFSGGCENRKNLILLQDELQKDDIVIVSDLSRLSRNTMGALGILEFIKNKGAKLIVLAQDFDFTTPIGVAVFTTLAMVSTLEKQNISAHTQKVMTRLSKEGILRSKPPFGYKFVGKDKDYEEEPEQQRVIRLIETKWEKCKNVCQIRNELNEEGEYKVLCLNKKKQGPSFFDERKVRRILMDLGLKDPKNRKTIEERIVSHKKTEG